MGNICSISISCDDICSRCLNCTLGKASYIPELENNLVALLIALQQLTARRDDVMTRVIIAEQQLMKRLNEVQGWLSRVEAVETEVQKLILDSYGEIEKLCLGGYCSQNCKSSYKFGKKVARMLQLVITLKDAGVFEHVAARIPVAPVDEILIDQTTIVGQQSIFDKIWRCIGEKDVNIIGLYGTGGVGKTTLLKRINNQFCNERQGFDVVIWVVVSKEPKLEKIQEDIGKKLGLVNETWKSKSFEDRAQDVSNTLSLKKFALLLDDVWKPVDLIEVGVPLPNPEKASKIIFSTRSLDVCGQMEADKEFEVTCLADDEALILFQEKVGRHILDSHIGISELAEVVVKECDGLPLALITIGRAMAYKKTIEEWNYTIQLLQRSVSRFPGMDKVYPRLKFSYDSLPDNNTRLCFLYCSLYGEDYKIPKCHLIDCWLSEGFLDEYDGSAGRLQGYSIIGILLRACLLEEENDFVKMHDVIRDMALWIACDIEKEKENFLVHASAGLLKAPEVDKWEGVRRISLMKNKIENLTEAPRCPDLLTLFLNFNNLKMIKSDFFLFMPSLTVLNLSYNDDLMELPSGISELVSLQHLDLSGTAVVALPVELKALVNLKCLNLENTIYLCRIPRLLLSSFSMLRVLRMFKCSYLTSGDMGSESLVEEMVGLKILNVLSITIGTSAVHDRFLRSPELQSCCQSLCFKLLGNFELLSVESLAEMKYLDTLHVLDCKCFEVVKVDYGNLQFIRESNGFPSLQTVHIESSSDLQDLTWLIFAPNLKYVNVSYCNDMEEIISVRKLGGSQGMMGNLNPFARLEILQLQYLPSLNSIYWSALPFPNLKEIFVLQCPILEKLPLNLKSAKDRKIVIKGKETWWESLLWEDQATQNAFLPCFRRLQEN